MDIVDRKLRVSFKGFNDKRQMELIANALSESYFLGYTDGAEDSVKLAKKSNKVLISIPQWKKYF